MKSIAFVYLPHPYLHEPDAQFPLGLTYLAAVCRDAGYLTRIDNFTNCGTVLEAVSHYVDNPVDYIGITATCLELDIAIEFANMVRRVLPKVKIIIGGPGTVVVRYHNILPDINHGIFDWIVLGEGERAIIDILQDKFPVGTLVVAESLPIEFIPVPAREYIIGKLGGHIFAHGKEYFPNGSTTIITTRGCPFRCAFCGEARTMVRRRDARSVAKEIYEVIRRFGIRQFRFSDDSFTLDKEYVLRLSKLLRPMNIAWRVSCRVKPLDKEMVDAMVSAGCKEFSFGIESFDNAVLIGLGKDTTAVDNAKALFTVKSAGATARVLFMIRTPFQSTRTVDINKDWLYKVPYDVIACTKFVPLPGSMIWDYPGNYLINIISRDMRDYNFYFWSNGKRNQGNRLFVYTNQNTDLIEEQSEEFLTYLENQGSINKG